MLNANILQGELLHNKSGNILSLVWLVLLLSALLFCQLTFAKVNMADADNIFKQINAANNFQQSAYIKASDTVANEWFGWSVAMSVDTLVVGDLKGQVLVFIKNTGTWEQQASIEIPVTGRADRFGYSVAISGDTIVVGAPFEDSDGSGSENNDSLDSGAIYVFVRNGQLWSQQAYLKASNVDTGDKFGEVVAIDADTIVVGVVREASDATGINGNETNNNLPYSGAAYVFKRTTGIWNQQAYLKASNGTPNNFDSSGDAFGDSVTIFADTIVVGAPYEDSNANMIDGDDTNNDSRDSGAAYVFQRNGAIWSQQAYLKSFNTDSYDRFGQSVAIHSDTIVVGADREDSLIILDETNNDGGAAGAAYVFIRDINSWSQQAYIKASNIGELDFFAVSVAIYEDIIVVGTSKEDSNATGVNGDGNNDDASDAGAAYVYKRTGANWAQQAYLKASNTDIDDRFARSVTIYGDIIAIGAYQEDSNAININGDDTNNSADNAGAVYVFNPDVIFSNGFE